MNHNCTGEALVFPPSCMATPLLQRQDSGKAVPRVISTPECLTPGHSKAHPKTLALRLMLRAILCSKGTLYLIHRGPSHSCKFPSVVPAGKHSKWHPSGWHFCHSLGGLSSIQFLPFMFIKLCLKLGGLLYLHVCLSTMCVPDKRPKRGRHQTPWNWSHF